MKITQQKSDFLYIGQKLLLWYKQNARVLPWRATKNPYNVWISEIILQQTRVNQGWDYYLKFIDKFRNVEDLANADIDDVFLYWKGLGYYSRAINLHKAAQQIITDYNGIFPNNYHEILKLKGIGKYTAAAVSSICFNEKRPAVDGNFYRVLSRLFADNFDISKGKAHDYFSELALLIMPDKDFGDFNQAIMDLGADICKPKNPNCNICPVQEDCKAFQLGKILDFPIKTKKIKSENMELAYYFIQYKNSFFIKQRNDRSIWKNLYDFPEKINGFLEKFIIKEINISHKLTHKNLNIKIYHIILNNSNLFKSFGKENNFEILNFENLEQKSFPKPLEKFIYTIYQQLYFHSHY